MDFLINNTIPLTFAASLRDCEYLRFVGLLIVSFNGQIHQTTSLMRWATVEVLSVAEKFLVVRTLTQNCGFLKGLARQKFTIALEKWGKNILRHSTFARTLLVIVKPE